MYHCLSYNETGKYHTSYLYHHDILSATRINLKRSPQDEYLLNHARVFPTQLVTHSRNQQHTHYILSKKQNNDI